LIVKADEAVLIRDVLKQFNSRRIEVEGTVSRIAKVWDSRARREVPSVCLNNVEIRDGDYDHPTVNHVWVTWALILINSGIREGDVIRLSAQVYQYDHRDPTDYNKFTTRYGLREPREIVCLNRTLRQDDDSANAMDDDERVLAAAPVLRDGDDDSPEPGPAPAVPAPTVNGVAASVPVPPAPQPVPLTDPKREVFDHLWDLTSRFGVERVKKTLAAVESLQSD
jgi:hypothetical protein